ncbi:MAG: acyltransferase [Barnesiella sp.]|nr:acyltransferase [Barnesiella sp.]
MTFATPRDIPQPNNFNIIRLFLAFYIVLVHFAALTDTETSLLIVRGHDCVCGFFVISGFLIYSSYCRSSSLKSYFEKRARRILPSYIFVVVLFAVALFLVSSVPVEEYFGRHWLKYLGSNLAFCNFVEPTLPGVFADNGMTAVNGSLWTIKIELTAYVMLPACVWLCRKIRMNPFIFFGVVILLSIAYRIGCNMMFQRTGDEHYLTLARQIGGLTAYFVVGMMMYELLDYVLRYKWQLFVIGLLAFIGAYCAPVTATVVKPFALGCIIIPAAFIGRWGVWLGAADISYDMYLLHFPVIQLVVHFRLPDRIGTIPSLMVVIAVVILLSCLTWHFIGEPFLRRKKLTSDKPRK